MVTGPRMAALEVVSFGFVWKVELVGLAGRVGCEREESKLAWPRSRDG